MEIKPLPLKCNHLECADLRQCNKGYEDCNCLTRIGSKLIYLKYNLIKTLELTTSSFLEVPQVP